MRIPVKVPSLPFAATEAYVGHWYRSYGEMVARNETLVELQIKGEIILIKAPQAGFLEILSLPELIEVGAILCYLKPGLANLTLDEEQGTLIHEIYCPENVTTSMEFELRRKQRESAAKLGRGFGTGLAAPQAQNTRQEQNTRATAQVEQARRFKVNPLLANSSQFAGDFKAAPAAVPSEAELSPALRNELSPGARPQLGPSAPTPKPM